MYDYLKEIPPGYKQEYKSLIGKVIPTNDSVKYQLIIMAYKEENFIGECVESLTNQTISPEEFEVLIINNCSYEEEFDNTEIVVKEKLERYKYDNIHLINVKFPKEIASAALAAKFGMECIVYMGENDIERQKLNVFKMKLLGADVRSVNSGSKTLKDATNEAIRDWVTNVENTYYLIGTVAGPHPYPEMVRDFQSVIGSEVRTQLEELEGAGSLPDTLVAAVGGGSNAMGLFYPFLDDIGVRLIGVEAGGEGVGTGRHAASLEGGRPGVLHGNRTYLLQDQDGQILDAHSISAGLDYPGIGPEHAWLHDNGRAEYVSITDEEALEAFQLCASLEGILPALEPAHALAHVMKIAPKLPPEHIIVMNMCGRGDKDIYTVAEALGVKI